MFIKKLGNPVAVLILTAAVLALFALIYAIHYLITPVTASNLPTESPAMAIESPVPAVTALSAINTPTPTQKPTEAPASTFTPSAPKSSYIVDITGHRQAYSLSCEASVAVDWARYFGVDIYEYTFQTSLPHSDNPDYGFVGDVNSLWGQVPPNAYGVYAGPVADLLQQYSLPAQAVKEYTLEEVKAKLADSKPIIVWVIGNMETSTAVKYTDSKGRTTLVAPYEHVVILTGYNQDSIRYMTNGRFYDIPTDVFLNSWGVLGNMAVIHE